MRELVMSAAILAAIVGCGSAPDTRAERANAQAQAETTLRMMKSRDPTLAPLLENAAGYVVFPEIGKGGLIAGAAHGRGVLYERGRPTGYVQLQQASIGAQVGAQAFAELIIFRNPADVQNVKGGDYSLGGNISAVALTSGVAASTEFDEGIAVFVVPRGGVMAEVSVSGQRLSYSRGG